MSAAPNSNLNSTSPPASSRSSFLESLGARVRQVRTQRGMTRKAAALAADVSERHLAQLETGEGNISIVLLRRIAAALGVSLVELLSPESNEPVEKRLIQRFLEHVPAHRLEDVVYRLMRDFGQQEKVRQMRIALIGLRGAGKSTLGAKLAADLRCPFIELDREIEKETGMPLADIFSLYGQSGYRAIERRTLERVANEYDRGVFSIGGGVVTEQETYDYLRALLHRLDQSETPGTHGSRHCSGRLSRHGRQRSRDGRSPPYSPPREPLYRKADVTLDTSNATSKKASPN